MKVSAASFRVLLNRSREERYPLVFVAPGSGQVAGSAVAGGAHFLMVLNAGVYRSAGVSSLCSFLPYGNANQQTLELLSKQILPRAGAVPLVAGVMASDPTLDLDSHLDQLARLGVVGVTNWPAVGLVDGSFRQILEEQGLTIQAEARCCKRPNSEVLSPSALRCIQMMQSLWQQQEQMRWCSMSVGLAS